MQAAADLAQNNAALFRKASALFSEAGMQNEAMSTALMAERLDPTPKVRKMRPLKEKPRHR